MRGLMSGAIVRNARLFLVGAALSSLLLAGIALVITAPPLRAADACAVTPGTGAYPTINTATTDANCASVTVPAGTFAEQITINHALTLTGAGTGKRDYLPPARLKEPATLVRSHGGTTVSGLTVSGQNYQCTANVCMRLANNIRVV